MKHKAKLKLDPIQAVVPLDLFYVVGMIVEDYPIGETIANTTKRVYWNRYYSPSNFIWKQQPNFQFGIYLALSAGRFR